MKKVMLWGLGIVVVVVIGIVLLTGAGLKMMDSAEKFVERDGLTNVVVIGNSDKVLCPAGTNGMLVQGDDGDTTKIYPVCVSLDAESTYGKWAKED